MQFLFSEAFISERDFQGVESVSSIHPSAIRRFGAGSHPPGRKVIYGEKWISAESTAGGHATRKRAALTANIACTGRCGRIGYDGLNVPLFPADDLRNTPHRQPCCSFLATEIRFDRQLQRGNLFQGDVIVFDLVGRARWAEVPLLPHDLFHRPPTYGRPSQSELLGAFNRRLDEMELNATDRGGLIENNPDSLLACFSRTPARPRLEIEGSFNRKARILGRDFDCGDFLKTQPSLFGISGSLHWGRAAHYSLPHTSIVAGLMDHTA